jgi:hypothetical protein
MFFGTDEKLPLLINEASDSDSLVQVIREIDRWLAIAPHEFGESRYDNVRVAFVSPLGVQFEILADPPTVIVLDVWQVASKH